MKYYPNCTNCNVTDQVEKTTQIPWPSTYSEIKDWTLVLEELRIQNQFKSKRHDQG